MVFTGLSCRGWGRAKLTAQAVTSALLLILGLAISPSAATARESVPETTVAVTALPTEAQATYRAIRNGGPFPYAKDGSVFGNRERLLPRQARGYYREYTVKTRGSRDRGARRIVCGGPAPTEPAACYYTDDHYASFRLIAQ